MNFDPKNFFIGLMDLFTILMPGALFVFAVQAWAGPLLLRDAYASLHGTPAVVAFLFASYLFGHFIFLLAAQLDDAYDKLRSTTPWNRMSKAARGGDPSVHVNAVELRQLALGRKDIDGELRVAIRIKDLYLQRTNAEQAINAFQWCKLKLQEKPEFFDVVQRFEADSKFFRSFSVVLAMLAPFWALRGNSALAVVCLVLMLLALWRYAEQRLKSTQHAYRSIISMHADGAFPEVPKDGMEQGPNAPTHAGGVVYEVCSRPKTDGKKGEVENYCKFLLVRAKCKDELWVLPKGHIEPWESPELAAVREVVEEAGAWCVVEGLAGEMRYTKANEQVHARLFRMKCVAQETPLEPRQHQWRSYAETLRLASHEETRDLITRVHDQVTISQRLRAK